MAALRERAVNLLEEATRLIREHTSQGPENGSPRNSAVAVAVNGRETNGRVLENFRNLFQPYTARERSTSFSRSSRQQSASAASAPATRELTNRRLLHDGAVRLRDMLTAHAYLGTCRRRAKVNDVG